MRRILFILTISVLLFGCALQRSSKTEIEIVTEKFLDSDSLNIRLDYRDFTSCIDHEQPRRIRIFYYNGETKIYGHKFRTSSETFVNIQGSLMSELQTFEKRAKESRGCGGFGGGHGVIVRLEINGEEDEFGYCKDTWDGIGELLTKIELRIEN